MDLSRPISLRKKHRPVHKFTDHANNSFLENAYFIIQSEAVINAGRKNDQIALFYQNTDPLVVIISDVKVATAIKNESDLFIRVEMLFKKHLDLEKKIDVLSRRNLQCFFLTMLDCPCLSYYIINVIIFITFSVR